MKNQIIFAVSVVSAIQALGCDETLVKQAVDSELASSDAMTFTPGEEVRKTEVKKGKDSPDQLKIKGSDKGRWTGVLTTPLSFFHLNNSLLNLEKDSCYLETITFAPRHARWLAKFALTDGQKAERKAKVDAELAFNEASRKLRAEMLGQ